MKKYKLIAPLALGAAAALAAGVAALLKKPAEAAESAAAPAPKTPAVPKHRCVGSYSFISGFQNAVTVEMEMDYDSEKYSFVVIEDGPRVFYGLVTDLRLCASDPRFTDARTMERIPTAWPPMDTSTMDQKGSW